MPLSSKGLRSNTAGSPTAQGTFVTSTQVWSMPMWPRTRHFFPFTVTVMCFLKIICLRFRSTPRRQSRKRNRSFPISTPKPWYQPTEKTATRVGFFAVQPAP